MADIITKAKLQLRVGNGEKVPMSPTKLLINHGKPNFTIQRSTSRVQENGEVSPMSPLNQANNNSNNNNNNNNNNDNSSNNSIKNNINHNNINNADNKSHSSNTNNNNNTNNNTNNNARSFMTTNGSNIVNGNVNNDVKTAVNGDVIVNSNKFNGALKSTTKPLATKEATHQRDDSTENEAARVVLRRTTRRTPELLAPKEDDDDAVPEFIRRQRRIQERLAKENVLDFENRRSGYFTHVLISPTSPSRTSFVETMSSPAIVPSLEMAAPAPPTAPKRESEELAKTRSTENKKDEQMAMVEKAEKMEQTNGHVKEKQTIHEEGEEEQKNEKEVPMNSLTEELNERKLPNDNIEEQKNQKAELERETTNGSIEKAKKQEEEVEEEGVQSIEPAEDHKEKNQEDERTNDQTAEQVAEAEVANAIEEVNKAVAGEDDVADEFTVSHTNEMPQTSVNTVEPISTVVVESVNGRNVVNIELPEHTPALDVETSVQHKSEAVLVNQPIAVGAEAVVIKVNHTSNGTDAISEKLNADEANNNNKLKSTDAADAELQALAQLKFEIKGADAENVVVTPVLRTE